MYCVIIKTVQMFQCPRTIKINHLSEFLHEFAIGDSDYSKWKDKAGDKEGDYVSMVLVVS